MAGWELKEGKLDLAHMDQDEFWNILKKVFSNRTRKSTSYKYCFFKAIIDNVFKCDMNYILTFEQLFDTATEIYWNLVHIHGIKQYVPTKRRCESRIEIIIRQIVEEYNIGIDTPYEYLDEKIQVYLKKCVNKELVTYVVGAFYGDTGGRFYEFSKKAKEIKLHPSVYEYIVRHKYLVEKLNYYEWLRFLEKVNPLENSYALANKLDEANKRSGLRKYREFLQDEFKQEHCFYCGKELKMNKIHVDHFIPWCYMKSDQLWNFVLACEKCNGKKSDKLPQYQYLEKLILRNQKIQFNHRSDFVDIEFYSYNKEKTKLIFNSAINNGLDINWGA